MSRLAFVALLSIVGAAFAQPAPTTAASQPTDDAFRYVTAIEPLDEHGLPVRVLRLEMIVLSDAAVVPDASGQPAMTFHLSERRASDNAGRSGTYDELLKRAQEARDRVLANLPAFNDPAQAQRIKLMAQPNFKVEQRGQTLTLSNEFATYEMELERLSPEQAKKLHLADRLQNLLNLDPNQPPFAALAVADELEKRQSFAKTIRLRVTSGGRTENLLVRTLVLPVTDQQRAQFGPVLGRK